MTTAPAQVQRGEFKNEPFVDFSKPENRQAVLDALAKVKAELGRDYPLVIDGQEISTPDKLRSINPSNADEVIGTFSRATPELADRAIESAYRAFQSWKRVPVEERAARLFRAGDILRQRKFEMMAWIVYEVGKTWPEADGDVAETIDHCEFYAREALRLGGPQKLNQLPGEKNVLMYIPLGVGLVIPPWNFPMALLAGMAIGSLVTGNTVVVKPSSDSPAVGYKFCQVMWEAGFPKEALSFVAGQGATVGDRMVAHPLTRYVAFTGSKEAGLHVHQQAAKVAPGQIWVKRTILEMGGKDAIIVDDEADIDAAVEGVTVSAFGYQGQKCSACSRAIVSAKIYEEFVKKLVERVKKIKVGPADDPNVFMGPVINKSSMESILEYIEVGKKEGKLVCGGGKVDVPGKKGFYLEPTVFIDIPPKSRLEQEEIFGPVLAVIKAKDYDHALEIANDTEYGLTGSVYTRNRAKLDRAVQEFHTGNLYLNRKCTGAMVGAHPFGGFNMSGTCSKVGGKDYLLLYLQAKSIAERV